MDNQIIYLVEKLFRGKYVLEPGYYFSYCEAEENLRNRDIGGQIPCGYRIVPFESQTQIAPAPPCPTKEPRYRFEFRDARPDQADLTLVKVLDMLARGMRGSISEWGCD